MENSMFGSGEVLYHKPAEQMMEALPKRGRSSLLFFIHFNFFRHVNLKYLPFSHYLSIATNFI